MKCKYTDVNKVKENIGLDWRNIEVKNLTLMGEDLTDVLLPEYPEFFRDITAKSLMKTKLPKGDYRGYNFEGVELWGAIFHEDSILPEDKDFFQKIRGKSVRQTVLPKIDFNKYNLDGVEFSGCVFADGTIFPEDKDFFRNMDRFAIVSCVFPAGDYSFYNFDEISIVGCEFKEGAILPSDTEFFKKIFEKNLYGTKLPKGDYSIYDFTKVRFDNVEFHREAIMPKYENFLNDVRTENSREHLRWTYPDDVVRNIHNYDLSNVKVNLTAHKRYAKILTPNQIDIIRNRYGDVPNIVLPEKVYGKEQKEVKTNGFSF